MPTQLSITLSNGTTVAWDGKGDNGSIVQTGQYFIEVHSKDGVGGETTVIKQLSVMAADPNTAGTIMVQPNVIDATKGILGTTFKANSSLTLTLKVSLYTLAGELTKAVAGTPDTGAVYLSASGLASGIYLAVVDSIDAQGRAIDKKILKVLVRH
jgi:hypothetical protein